MAIAPLSSMDSALSGDDRYSELKHIVEATAKMNHPSWLPHTNVGIPTSHDSLSDILDAGSNISHMSMDTSVAPQQSERSHGTASKTPEFSSHTSPDLTEGDIKKEPGLEMDVDHTSVYEHQDVNHEDEATALLSEFQETNAFKVHEAETRSPASSSPKRRRIASKSPQLQFTNFRARTSITSESLPREELARQSIEAALSSRLNPYTLHPDEYRLLRQHISPSHVTTYLNIRNRILRLWVRNPLVSVTPEEAAGCAFEDRFLSLAQVAYDWLVRRGYINFGCVEVPDFTVLTKRAPKINRRRKRIVVIGAGMSGLGCARQLEGLSNHYRQRWTSHGEEPPEIIVLEGRARLGGRIYSIPLKDQNTTGIPDTARATAETGAHIITGFDHGNPLNMIVRGQLAIPYYPLKDNSKLYDIDGRIVDMKRDRHNERLFNKILEQAGKYRHKLAIPKTVEGNRDLIEAGKDPTLETETTIAAEEEASNALSTDASPPREQSDNVPVGVDKLTGKAHMATSSEQQAILSLAPSIPVEESGQAQNQDPPPELDLDSIAHSGEFPSLGKVMDEAVKQYQGLYNLTPQDLRILNWHFANLEYANAAGLGKLSLGGWDLDIGNEFEGEHTQVIGGYIQVPRGLWQAPNELDLRTRKEVKKIAYDPRPCKGGTISPTTYVECADGEIFYCDQIVLTAPLGVLKSRSISFDPPLPDWKERSIAKLGFGLLNKLILVFNEPFWDVDRDMIGLLRETPNPESNVQEDYAINRGRFYFFWNCIKTTGRPVLIALMAGDAAHQAEARTDGELVLEVIQQLAKMFKKESLPQPSEAIVTRWGRDKFARGTYSYVAPEAHAEDYDVMAKSTGNLYFAGEATCGTHPATVHGAYLSGLRAAADVVEDLLGPIQVPSPLVPDMVKLESPSTTLPMAPAVPSLTPQTTEASTPNGESDSDKQARLQAIETEILNAIFEKLGPRPDKPEKAGANPFLLFSKDKWAGCKAVCDNQVQVIRKDAAAKASRNEVRAALGKMWREASEEVKRPYIEQTQENRANNKDAKTAFKERQNVWDNEAIEIRKEYLKDHPGLLAEDEEANMWEALGVYKTQERRAKMESGYAE